jgi:hypothetical protein
MSKMPPKRIAEVLPSVPKRRKSVMCLMEKIRVLDKLRSGISYSARWPRVQSERVNNPLHQEKGKGNTSVRPPQKVLS